MTVRILQGDCRDVLKALEADSIDACVTDPPYGLSFMGKAWDYDVPSADIWREVYRVLKPGAHLLAFFGSRTYHRGVVQIEDAGFEIRDQIMWVYGSGFPKSHDVAKSIDRSAGVAREDKFEASFERRAGPTGNRKCDVCGKWLVSGSPCQCPRPQDAAKTDAARQWEGWGTALKPAHEPIVVARKPLIGTVAENVQRHGTGAINIDASRIHADDAKGYAYTVKRTAPGATQNATGKTKFDDGTTYEGQTKDGRWPANVIHDGSDEVVALFPPSSVTGNRSEKSKAASVTGTSWGTDNHQSTEYLDSGSAARFFYCAKADKADRDEGLDAFPQKPVVTFQTENGTSGKASSISEGRETAYRNTHPTVKPTALMRYLVKLVTPPKGIVLDPFMGSGSTGKAAVREGFSFTGVEQDEQWIPIAKARIHGDAPLFAEVAP